jgi:outer membrane murein-binding lipoprotein Lpp
VRHRRLRLVAAAVLGVCAAACAGGAERAVIDQFFAASRLRDLTALEKISSVIFEPRQDGTVLSYDIQAIRPAAGATEEVLVNATVRLPSGKTERRPLLITLKRVQEAWRVTSVRVSTESASP